MLMPVHQEFSHMIQIIMYTITWNLSTKNPASKRENPSKIEDERKQGAIIIVFTGIFVKNQ